MGRHKVASGRRWVGSIMFAVAAVLGCGTEDGSEAESTLTGGSLKDRINATGELIVGFEPDAPPVFFQDESGNATGFDFELVQYLAKEVFDGVSIRTIEDGYDKLPELLRDGRIQLMAGGRTADEEEGILFSSPYLSFGYSLVTRREDARRFPDLQSLSRATVGVYDDVALQWVKERLPGANVVVIGALEDENTPESDWMAGLVNRSVDAVVYDYPFASNEIADYRNALVITARNLDPDDLSEYVLALASAEPGAEELRAEINVAIARYKESSRFAEAVTRYIPNPGGDDGGQVAREVAYVVNPGESLSLIARNHLGAADRWRDLYRANPQVASPDIIYPGQLLNKPDGWRDR